MRKNLILFSGIGLGAGLVYALQQDQRVYRRVLTRVIPDTLSHRLGRWFDSAQRSIQRQARERLPRLSQRHSSYALPASPHSRRSDMVTGLVVIGSLALGAGLMYVLDPDRGRQRRMHFQQAGTSSWRRLTSTVRKTSRHLGNRTCGVLAEWRRQGRSADMPADAVLIARVRSQIGHVISQPSAIDVDAHQGRVTLSGQVPAEEVDQLLKTAAGVSGVHEIVNQLGVHEKND